MAEEENGTEATETDIFKQQEQTINLLYDVLQKQQSAPKQPTYVTQAQATKAAPNYMMYIGIGIAVLWFLKGK